METQSLYHAELKIIIDSVELKIGETRGRSQVKEERRRERKTRKETKRNRKGRENIFIACASLD